MIGSAKRELLILKRKQSLVPQIMVANRIGVSQAQYSYIENGYADPDEHQAQKLIEIFDLPKGYFDKEEDDGVAEPDKEVQALQGNVAK